MKDFNEAAIRLGLALHRKSLQEGDHFFKIYELVFENNEQPTSLFRRIFGNTESFWEVQTEAARILENSGLAIAQRIRSPGVVLDELSLRLTPLGRAMYSLASLQSEPRQNEIEGLVIEDLEQILQSETTSELLANDLRQIDDNLEELNLTNYQRATVNSYVNVLIAITSMPQADSKLFWTVLERLSQFAGVASLIVALIALRLVK